MNEKFGFKIGKFLTSYYNKDAEHKLQC